MNPRGPGILALLLAAGALLSGLFADMGIVEAGEPGRDVLQDEAFLFASVLWT